MQKHLRFMFIFLFFISFVFGCHAAEKNTGNNLALAPGFKLTDLNDRVVSFSDYKGKKAVVLFFWTTWCPYCREELKTLNEKYEALAKDSIELLAINVGEPKYKVENFVKSRHLNFEVLLDKDNQVSDAYALMGVPTYFVINKSGSIVSSENHFPGDILKELSSK